MDMVESVNGTPIRLPAERWKHLVYYHPEMVDYYAEILGTIADPERIFEGRRGEWIAVREHSPGKYFAVIYREIEDRDGFVITAFLTRRIKQIERGRLVWEKS